MDHGAHGRIWLTCMGEGATPCTGEGTGHRPGLDRKEAATWKASPEGGHWSQGHSFSSLLPGPAHALRPPSRVSATALYLRVLGEGTGHRPRSEGGGRAHIYESDRSPQQVIIRPHQEFLSITRRP